MERGRVGEEGEREINVREAREREREVHVNGKGEIVKG